MRALALTLLLAAPALAGCLDAADLTPDAANPVPVAVPGFWKTDWTVLGTDVDVRYDPIAEDAAVTGTVTLINELGRPQPSVVLWFEPMALDFVKDETGVELAVTPENVPSPMRFVPGLGTFANAASFNVTLTGNVAPGAVRTLSFSLTGWPDDSARSVAAAPNEFTALTHFGFVPTTNDGGGANASHALTVTYPADEIVLLSAQAGPSTTADGWTTTAFTSNSFFGVVLYYATGLEWLEDDVDGVDVRTFFTPDMRAQGQVVHDVTKRTLRAMPEYTGPYPFQRLYTVPHEVAANAFSTEGLTFMGVNFYRFHVPDAPYQFGRLTPYAAGRDGFEMVVVHEHIHNWWGHNVRGANWDVAKGPRDTWLTEGITTYLSELVWFDTQYGEDDAKASADGKVADQAQGRALDGGERAITESGGDYYEKTAIVLRGLEAYGLATGRPTAVFDALKLLQERHGVLNGGKASLTTWEGLAAFNETFEEDLLWFFEPHWFGRDLPDLAITLVADDAGADNLTVQVSNIGGVKAAALVRAVTATGREFQAWGVVPGGGATDIMVAKPVNLGTDPVVRVIVDPLQHINEWDETNNEHAVVDSNWVPVKSVLVAPPHAGHRH